MKNVLAIFVALAALCVNLCAQSNFAVFPAKCQALRVSVSSPESHSPNDRTYYVYWIERQVAPGVWDMYEKRISPDTALTFENLPPGVYRAQGMAEKKDRAIFGKGSTDATLSRSRSVQVGSCSDDRSVGRMDAGDISLYPNPAKNVLHFLASKGDLGDNTWLELFNAVGQRVANVHLTAFDQTIDVSQFAAGMYFANINQGGSPVLKQKITIAK